jgi:hypothetical protein
MRPVLLLACSTLLAVGSASAAERCAPTGSNSVWIEGRWQQCGGQYTWQPGYWQTTTTTVCTTPPPQWVEGRWAQGANGMVWVEGHYEQAPTVCTTPPPVVYTPPPQVVYTPPPQVVYVPQRPAVQTTVVIGGGYYGNNGYCAPVRPVCPPPVYHRPVCPPPVVVCPPRPVTSIGVCLPKPSIGFPTINGHKIPIPVPVFRKR